MPRVLILTASMGEGHNTAARNIRDAILAETQQTAEVLVADPYTRTNPVINKLVQQGYTMAINKYPKAWKVVFDLLSRRGVVEGMGPILAELNKAVDDMIQEFKPDIIASTYPIFAFIVGKIRKKRPSLRVPLYTVITDSTQINSAWYRFPCEGSLVADQHTADILLADAVPAERIHVLGFPVSLAFDGLTPSDHPQGSPWKVIFFPGGRTQRATTVLRNLSEIPNVEITVVTGRRQSMFDALKKAGLPKKGQLLGWTPNMPELMSQHHLFIGKAGGATVQEAIAAQLPFLVSHVVPGQEEGNIELIETQGIGTLATGKPTRIAEIVRGAIANDGQVWHAWRNNLATLHKPSASRTIARFLLDKIKT